MILTDKFNKLQNSNRDINSKNTALEELHHVEKNNMK